MDEYVISSSSSLPSDATECEVLEDWLGKFTDSGNKSAPIRKFTVTNTKSKLSLSVQVINYGATITSLKLKDPQGGVENDIVLGFDTVEEYYNNLPYFGSLVGRCANRIANGRFSLHNSEYRLPTNNGPNHLHGGILGFDKRLFESHVQGNSIVFSYTSSDGEEGYPGAVHCQVKYTVTDADELVIEYKAKSNKPTPINLTNHSYFNLAGHKASSMASQLKEHYIAINAHTYTPVDGSLIPTGKIAPVSGTPYDLTKFTKMDDIFHSFQAGIDHNFCLKSKASKELNLAAFVYHPGNSLVMEVYTTTPGIQFYMGSFIPSGLKGKSGVRYGKHSGFCLETQYYPNYVNQPNFPQSIIYPGNDYLETTVYKFSSVQQCDLCIPNFTDFV